MVKDVYTTAQNRKMRLRYLVQEMVRAGKFDAKRFEIASRNLYEIELQMLKQAYSDFIPLKMWASRNHSTSTISGPQ